MADRLVVRTWCHEHCEFHNARQSDVNSEHYTDKCGNFVEVKKQLL